MAALAVCFIALRMLATNRAAWQWMTFFVLDKRRSAADSQPRICMYCPLLVSQGENGSGEDDLGDEEGEEGQKREVSSHTLHQAFGAQLLAALVEQKA
eukprot:1142206-Pelagomonas_calceolata.AAC.3